MQNWNGSLSVNQDMIARQVTRNLRLADARPLRDTVVSDLDGQWLIETLRRVRRMKLGTRPSDGVVSEVDRTLRFRSSITEHNLDPELSEQNCRQFDVPKGSYIIKTVGGRTFSDVGFTIVVADGSLRLRVKYNQDKVPVLCGKTPLGDARSARAAGTRIVGTSPSRYF